MIRKFTDLEAWKEAHILTLLIYQLTNQFPKSEIYGLTCQMRRAAVSIESCIAEGFCRYHYKDRLNFYYDARGSIGELESQSITAKDLKYLSEDNCDKLGSQIQRTSILLGGLIRSTQRIIKK